MQNYSKWKNFPSLLFLLQILFFSPAFAQDSKSFTIRPWAVGQSATYQTKTFKDGRPVNTGTTTYSVVGQETAKGKSYFWLEIEQDEQGGVTLIQKLQVREPEAIDFENYLDGGIGQLKPRRKIREILLPPSGPLKRSSLNELEMPTAAVSEVENGPAPIWTKDLTGQYQVTPDQSIHTAGGTFKAIRFQSSGQAPSNDAWGAPEIPIWGLVKASREISGDEGTYLQQTELLSFHESGAVMKITKEPRLVTLKEQEVLKQNLSKPASSGSSEQGQP